MPFKTLKERNEYSKQWRLKNKDKRLKIVRKCLYKRRYNLTLDGFNALAATQNYVCAICNTSTKLVVDHSHTTGSIRGLLCGGCNSLLGFAKDSEDIPINAIEYLRRTNKC